MKQRLGLANALLTPDAGAALAVLSLLGLVPDTDQAGADQAGTQQAGADQAGTDQAGTQQAGADHPGTGRVAPRPGGTQPVNAWLPEGEPPNPEEIVAALVSARARVQGFSVDAESLENRFVELTGSGFNVAR